MSQYTIDQLREAKLILEKELTQVLSTRLRLFAETTGVRVEAVDVSFLTLRGLGGPAVPIFQRAQVKLEDI